jgi:hypothetical protein
MVTENGGEYSAGGNRELLERTVECKILAL